MLESQGSSKFWGMVESIGHNEVSMKSTISSALELF